MGVLKIISTGRLILVGTNEVFVGISMFRQIWHSMSWRKNMVNDITPTKTTDLNSEQPTTNHNGAQHNGLPHRIDRTNQIVRLLFTVVVVIQKLTSVGASSLPICKSCTRKNQTTTPTTPSSQMNRRPPSTQAASAPQEPPTQPSR